ncbi:MAG TPA: nitrophenyl compound nitroreductase subunit ArsF family protein [Paludibacteraceae bacterium]|nr:nitrophenyl compound nitroreductase subunit ArsF family protein [Paludibacteraceae bacterium]HPT42542.1 nitrophenyl compound nitroreductase subunit ArsF family protein [Paludibacteraceae bacterium]
MKKFISLSLVMLFLVSFFWVNSLAADKKTKTAVSKTAKVEVYYFHFTRRCVTCQAVETESQKAIAALYPAQYKSGKIIFKSLNLDEDNSKALAEKCKAEGQQLLIISGNKRFDITEQGFMYARSNPDKLKQELKTTIDPLIK